ncbi:hypothetical protein K2173_000376 [Erythroxylum novogranatense]|uniref:Secreted protein n=1 Tax=Erythroxylum novogranatense TaxID=1862640 RepID=A0AAV8SXB1_9ROSI|nr:hypothetical protein K2173_000376 [Erythroxylum novogranatense]
MKAALRLCLVFTLVVITREVTVLFKRVLRVSNRDNCASYLLQRPAGDGNDRLVTLSHISEHMHWRR